MADDVPDDRRRVLVVDDEPTIAASVADRLRAEGFDVDITHDGPDAVARARDGRPDLVVLDVMLPGFGGLEACRQIQADRPVPVLMLTARRRDRPAGRARGRRRRLPDQAVLPARALAALPEPVRSCTLTPIAARLGPAEPGGWRSTNASREAARALLAELRPLCPLCPEGRTPRD